jgi:hypothetical protein
MSNQPDPRRRALLLAMAATGATGLAACGNTESTMNLSSFAEAMLFVDRLKSGKAKIPGDWSVAQMLEHAAQSIEYSIKGYPESKSRLFQSTLGSWAFSHFKSRGKMSHSLTEPIPGAPALQANDIGKAAERLRLAIISFTDFSGKLQPHFAYGDLSKDEYQQAHLMHLANHFSVVTFDA